MTNKIIDQLEDSGYETYIVGGCVRDEFLNRKNKIVSDGIQTANLEFQ